MLLSNQNYPDRLPVSGFPLIAMPFFGFTPDRATGNGALQFGCRNVPSTILRNTEKGRTVFYFFQRLFALAGKPYKKKQVAVARRWQRGLQVEVLGARNLPAVSPVSLSSTGQLLITGAASDDMVLVSPDVSDASKIDVVFNGTTFLFQSSKVKLIKFTGSAGDDSFTNDTSINSSATGGIGADTFLGGQGKDNFNGGDGDDDLDGRGGADTLQGMAGDDSLHGGNGADIIKGGLGDDSIDGGSGNDGINGEAGDDRLLGGDGDDSVEGGSGNDNVFGEAGDDHLVGHKGSDLLFGGTGDDSVNGSGGDDSVHGGLGDDSLLGGGGNDDLDGGIGDDSVDGGGGDDSIDGGSGLDHEVNGEHQSSDIHLEADLSNGAGATGKAEFNATASEFEVQIEGAQANTTYDVLIDGTKVGVIVTNALGAGQMEVYQPTFTVTTASTIAVGDPAAGGLTGSFLGEAEMEFKATLTASVGAATGSAEYNAGELVFEVKVFGASAKTSYDVTLDGTFLGMITTDSNGKGEWKLFSVSLAIKKGSMLTIGDLANPLLSGTFA